MTSRRDDPPCPECGSNAAASQHHVVNLLEVLNAVDHTLSVHGHIDSATPLHARIRAALELRYIEERAMKKPSHNIQLNEDQRAQLKAMIADMQLCSPDGVYTLDLYSRSLLLSEINWLTEENAKLRAGLNQLRDGVSGLLRQMD